jgi:hypothetical protein
MALKNWIKNGADYYTHKTKRFCDVMVDDEYKYHFPLYDVWFRMGGDEQKIGSYTSKQKAHEALMKIVRKY